jgi:hypothetical protein
LKVVGGRNHTVRSFFFSTVNTGRRESCPRRAGFHIIWDKIKVFNGRTIKSS